MAARGRPIEFRCIRDAHPQRCYKRTIVRSAIWNHIGSVNVNACDNGVMTRAGNLAAVVCRSGFEDLSETAREELKIRVLDSLGCAVGALEGEPVRILRRQIGEFEPQGKCTLIGGGSAAPDSAAFYNGALVRYLDFNDAYLAKGETCAIPATIWLPFWRERSGRTGPDGILGGHNVAIQNGNGDDVGQAVVRRLFGAD